MTRTSYESALNKTRNLFQELAGTRSERIESNCLYSHAQLIARALSRDFDAATAQDIGFHLSDWSIEAAFLVALFLAPENFTEDEIRAGINNIVIHVPYHVAEAAKLAGHPL